MVSTEDEEVLGVFDLVCEQKADGLEGLLASVYIVAEEEVVGLWRETTVLEQAEEIVILAMDITADLWQERHSKLANGRIRDSTFCGGGCYVAGLTLMGASSSRRMG